MPIKKENRALYPPRKEWAAIRAEVLAREGNACKFCGAPNGEIILRDFEENWYLYKDASDFNSVVGLALFGEDSNPVKIVLTIAHLDHDPTNNGEPGNRPNLAALCQLHHLRYDAKHHAANARKTRNARRGFIELGL